MSGVKPKILLIHTIAEQEQEWFKILNSQPVRLNRESPNTDVVKLLIKLTNNKLPLPDLILLDMAAKIPKAELLQISSLCRWCKDNNLSLKIVALNTKQDFITKIEQNWAKRQGLIDIFPRLKPDNYQVILSRISEILGITLTQVLPEIPPSPSNQSEPELPTTPSIPLPSELELKEITDRNKEETEENSLAEDLFVNVPEITLESISQAIIDSPNSASLYCQRGDIYLSLGDVEKALNDYNKAIKLDSKLEQAYLSRSDALIQTGDYRTALKDLTQVIKINPQNAFAFHKSGLARFHSGDEQGAKKDYDQALKLKPDFSQAYNDRASLFYLLGKTELALADYKQAIKYNPDYALAYYNRGNIYNDLGDFEQAIADYTQAIRCNPNFALAYGNRGIAYYELDMVNKAIQDTTKAANLFHEQGDLDSYQRAIDTLKQMQ